ncbi:MAG: hypothetical protein ACREEL_08885 [Stellaceae bacterium]
MRVLTVLHPLVVIVALSAPLAQAALAGQTQQALVHQNSVTSSFSNDGPYSDQLLAPAVGD